MGTGGTDGGRQGAGHFGNVFATGNGTDADAFGAGLEGRRVGAGNAELACVIEAVADADVDGRRLGRVADVGLEAAG